MEKEFETTLTDGNALQKVPVLPLRDVVVYPHMVIPLFVGREKSIKALEHATDENKQILLVAQKIPVKIHLLPRIFMKPARLPIFCNY